MEGIDWISLDESESVIWSGSPRIHSIVPVVLFSIPLIPVLGIGVLLMIFAYLSVKNTDFVLTDQGVYRKSGVLSKDVQKIGFNKIQNISYSQGVFGNYFGYGNVDISTAGGSGVEMRFRSIEEPQNVQQRINTLIEEEKKSGQKPEDGRDSKEVLEDILSELEEINDKL